MSEKGRFDSFDTSQVTGRLRRNLAVHHGLAKVGFPPPYRPSLTLWVLFLAPERMGQLASISFLTGSGRGSRAAALEGNMW